HHSARIMRDFSDQVMMSPDTAHMLEVHMLPPTIGVRVLARADRESDNARMPDAVDWRLESALSLPVWQRRVRHRLADRHDVVSRALLSRSWRWAARARLAHGLRLLGAGEVVLTDRLHAAILGLLGGRHVVAADNTYGKLQRYFDAWYPD